MKVARFAVAVAFLAFGCSREMRLPTDPVDVAPSSSNLTPAPDSANHGQSATGHVDQTQSPFGIVVINQYSFSAIRTPHGRINGQFEFRAKFQGQVVRAHGDVECLSINGNQARVAGRVTQSTFPEGVPIDSELTWTVTDNGEGGRGRDTASQMLGFPKDLFCAATVGQYPEAPIRRGNIQVRP
jgi:hypothetical protein